jgi:RNA polymerase sigma-70 factor (ECF subfamily)
MPDNLTPNTNLLLDEVAKGNESAFGELFNAYDIPLNVYILKITKSEPLTRELVQDVFLKIWMNRSSLTQIECFRSYLFVIARNLTFDCLKQINRRKKREKEWINIAINHPSNQITESTTNISHEKIEAAVKLLPPQQKKVYVFKKNGMKGTEIAKELNISEGTVKKHMVLAMRFLKNHIRANMVDL